MLFGELTIFHRMPTCESECIVVGKRKGCDEQFTERGVSSDATTARGIENWPTIGEKTEATFADLDGFEIVHARAAEGGGE